MESFDRIKYNQKNLLVIHRPMTKPRWHDDRWPIRERKSRPKILISSWVKNVIWRLAKSDNFTRMNNFLFNKEPLGYFRDSVSW
ncbi:hypothetical protein Avbf_06991 [Armadillidium vulgare]|nr:hypothetical protein Avbf_06991 [Armadillidium vulgare]